jgi:hypothetical protein
MPQGLTGLIPVQKQAFAVIANLPIAFVLLTLLQEDRIHQKELKLFLLARSLAIDFC